MIKKIVICQPMFLPWYGIFEQIRFSDIFVILDDAAMPTGKTFINRVQVKTCNGIVWLTVPLQKHNNTLIKNLKIDNTQNWREKHLKTLAHAFAKSPYKNLALRIVEDIYTLPCNSLCDLNVNIMQAICGIFNWQPNIQYSSTIASKHKSTLRILELIKYFNANVYITGHGAKNYLQHEKLELYGIHTYYMEYHIKQYPQNFKNFTSAVTILDIIANIGPKATNYFASTITSWKKLRYLHSATY